MAAIENFILKIKVEGQKAVDDLKKSVDDLGKSAGAFGANASKMTSAISGIVGGLGGVVGIAALGATAIAGLAMKAVSLADSLQDISDATGITAGSLSNFKNSLAEAGGKADDFSALATKLTQNLGEAATGNEAAQKSFQKLGVFVRDANGNIRDSGTVLQEVIGKLAAISDPATRSALAVELLGKSAKMIDFTKVNAINDPFKDEQIKQLAKYQEALDKIATNAANNLLTVFGKLAIAIDSAQQKADAAQKAANERGNTIDLAPFSGQPIERPMTKSEKDRYELQKKLNEAYRDQGREINRLQSIGKPAGGDFGATPEATLKAIEESRKRIAQSGIDARKFAELKGANDIQAIQVNANAEIAKAREEIFTKERLTEQQKAAEFAAKKKEIESKAATETARYQGQQNAKIYSELEAQRQKSADELAQEDKRINDLVETTRQLTVEQQYQLDAQTRKKALAIDSAGMSDREKKNAEEIFALEEERLAVLRKIAETKDLPYAERLRQEQAINSEIDKRISLTKTTQQLEQANNEDFILGFQKAYRNYNESAKNSAEYASTVFKTFTTGLEDAFVKFVQTGKLSFRDLVNSLIADIARANIRSLLSNLTGNIPGSQGGSGGIFGGRLIPGFLAGGGAAMAGMPYMVGEQGPEMFVPRTSGNVIPNNQLNMGTQSVVYNINAVDAGSFKSLVARDPAFIHAVAQQGARSQPARR